jgi:Trk K+ transport system NAD-binding subunit
MHPLVLNSMSFAGGQSLVEVRVPEELAGKRLQDLTLEAEYGLKAALILDGDSSELARPTDDRVLKQGDALLLFGSNEKFFEMEKRIPGLPSLRARLAAGLRGGEPED